MIGQEFGNPAAARQLAHPLPEADGLVWVVAGERHEEKADVVRLRLLLTIESLLQQNIDVSRLFAGHPFVGVMGQCMGDFMR